MIFKKFREWDERRGLVEFNKEVMHKMLSEELQEFKEAKSEHDMIDALCDLIKVSSQGIGNLGYDVNDSLHEMFKEINSREQCPAQAMRWAIDGSNGEKWQKNKNQSKSTLYKANYLNCKT